MDSTQSVSLLTGNQAPFLATTATVSGMGETSFPQRVKFALEIIKDVML